MRHGAYIRGRACVHTYVIGSCGTMRGVNSLAWWVDAHDRMCGAIGCVVEVVFGVGIAENKINCENLR